MRSVAHESVKFNAGGVELHYRKFGAGGATPALICHGLSYFSYDWIDIAGALAADRAVAAIDMRGFGDSGWSSNGDYSVPTMAGDIVAALDHLGWQRAILIGHSMGGRNTTLAAARNPGRVAGLVLVDYSPENAPQGSKRVAQNVANVPDVFATIEDAMRHFGADPSGPKRPRFEAYLRRVGGGYAIKRDPHFRDHFRRIIETGERPKLGVDMWQALSEVACPILAVRGSRSDMFAVETVPKVKAANPRLMLVEVDAGHNVGGDNPAALIDAVRPFLASLER